MYKAKETTRERIWENIVLEDKLNQNSKNILHVNSKHQACKFPSHDKHPKKHGMNPHFSFHKKAESPQELIWAVWAIKSASVVRPAVEVWSLGVPLKFLRNHSTNNLQLP